MKVSWAVPIIASILILGVIGFSQDASAVGGTISGGPSCIAIGGEWDGISTCTHNSLLISSGETITISSGIGAAYPGKRQCWTSTCRKDHR